MHLKCLTYTLVFFQHRGMSAQIIHIVLEHFNMSGYTMTIHHIMSNRTEYNTVLSYKITHLDTTLNLLLVTVRSQSHNFLDMFCSFKNVVHNKCNNITRGWECII